MSGICLKFFTREGSNWKLLLLTCPGSMEFRAVSRSFQLQSQNPLDGKRRPAFSCHGSQSGRHNDWTDWEQRAPGVLTKQLKTTTNKLIHKSIFSRHKPRRYWMKLWPEVGWEGELMVKSEVHVKQQEYKLLTAGLNGSGGFTLATN